MVFLSIIKARAFLKVYCETNGRFGLSCLRYSYRINNLFLWHIPEIDQFEVCSFWLIGSLPGSGFDLAVGIEMGDTFFL